MVEAIALNTPRSRATELKLVPQSSTVVVWAELRSWTRARRSIVANPLCSRSNHVGGPRWG